MTTLHSRLKPLLLILALGLVILPSAGCVGALAQAIYMFKGLTVKAEYPHLKGKRVAVVCVSDSSSFGLDTSSEMLARYIEATLRKNVKKIDLIRQEEVMNWIDNNNWDQIDFTEIGRGVDAELVVAVELSSYGLTNGSTLFQGRADVTTSVYDLTNGGRLDWRNPMPSYKWPKEGGRPVTDTDRARFEQKFIYQISQHVANNFYDHEVVNDISNDASMLFD